jgi:hypothetical protein
MLIKSLLFITESQLNELSTGSDSLIPIPKNRWLQPLCNVFGTKDAGPSLITDIAIYLTENGENVSHLLGIGNL